MKCVYIYIYIYLLNIYTYLSETFIHAQLKRLYVLLNTYTFITESLAYDNNIKILDTCASDSHKFV